MSCLSSFLLCSLLSAFLLCDALHSLIHNSNLLLFLLSQSDLRQAIVCPARGDVIELYLERENRYVVNF